MKKKFVLILVTLIILSFAVLTPLPTEATGGYCTMRSTFTISEDDAPKFEFDTETTIKVGETVGYGVDPEPDHPTPMWGLICMIGTVGYITRMIFLILAPIFVLLGIWGGFKIMTAAGEEKKVTAGKNIILYAVIGFVLLLLIRGLPAMIRFIVGM